MISAIRARVAAAALSARESGFSGADLGLEEVSFMGLDDEEASLAGAGVWTGVGATAESNSY
jgi:hypothetical protein